MDCTNAVGVRNVFIKFFDCDTNRAYPPVVHKLAGDELPKYKTCSYSNEALTDGFVGKTRSNQMMNINVIRNLGIPLSLYQGCSSVDVTVEHYNGLVMTGIGGTVVNSDTSDAHEVSMEISFEDLDEFRPETLQAA